MSLTRSPPNIHLSRASGSTPNLCNYDIDEEQINMNPRKRPHPLEYDYKSDLEDFRNEIKNLIKESISTQTLNITKLGKEMKEEIKDLKHTTEELTKEYKKLNDNVMNIICEHESIKNKINTIEDDLKELKKNPKDNHQHKTATQHEMIQEIQDRLQREKNIIMVNLVEENDKNTTSDSDTDLEKAYNILKSIRLGKILGNKPRPLKLIFENTETPKHLLKNRSKVSANTKIYSDQTPAQRKYLQNLQTEMEQRAKNGESNLKIRYIKGIPTITESNTYSKN
ncbi:hypothetical protein ABMA28_011773 [Loxostege sticticalis]|uniref:Uncharacterized protein n=1 Tax=Loxostege sticticalis TaxID=481309 RepID=A0ABD0TKK0_LOXSC